jgi:hypothetical protein
VRLGQIRLGQIRLGLVWCIFVYILDFDILTFDKSEMNAESDESEINCNLEMPLAKNIEGFG